MIHSQTRIKFGGNKVIKIIMLVKKRKHFRYLSFPLFREAPLLFFPAGHKV